MIVWSFVMKGTLGVDVDHYLAGTRFHSGRGPLHTRFPYYPYYLMYFHVFSFFARFLTRIMQNGFDLGMPNKQW